MCEFHHWPANPSFDQAVKHLRSLPLLDHDIHTLPFSLWCCLTSIRWDHFTLTENLDTEFPLVWSRLFAEDQGQTIEFPHDNQDTPSNVRPHSRSFTQQTCW